MEGGNPSASQSPAVMNRKGLSQGFSNQCPGEPRASGTASMEVDRDITPNSSVLFQSVVYGRLQGKMCM